MVGPRGGGGGGGGEDGAREGDELPKSEEVELGCESWDAGPGLLSTG